MKYSEILAQYEIIAVRPPRKGELFMTVPNHSEEDDCYGVTTATKNFKYLNLQILKEKESKIDEINS